MIGKKSVANFCLSDRNVLESLFPSLPPRELFGNGAPYLARLALDEDQDICGFTSGSSRSKVKSPRLPLKIAMQMWYHFRNATLFDAELHGIPNQSAISPALRRIPYLDYRLVTNIPVALDPKHT